MKTKNIIKLAAGLFLSFGIFIPAHADGLIGQRYVAIDGIRNDYSGFGSSWGLAGFGNTPFNESIDLSFGGSYERVSIRGVPGRVHGYSVGTGILGHLPMAHNVKLFGAGGLGWEWATLKGPAVRVSDDSWFYVLSAGIEVVQGPLSFAPFIAYTDAPDISGSGSYVFGVNGNYWLNERYGVRAGVGVTDGGSSGSDVLLSLGLTMRY